MKCVLCGKDIKQGDRFLKDGKYYDSFCSHIMLKMENPTFRKMVKEQIEKYEAKHIPKPKNLPAEEE